MDKNQTEIFGEFTYPESMTYFELLDAEEFLKEQLDLLFIDAGAAHLDFTPHGDMLMLQCAFEFRNLEILRDIAQQVAELLPKGMHGRILCLEKNLSSYHLFWIERGQWQEGEYKLSKHGPADAHVNKTNVIEREVQPEEAKKGRHGGNMIPEGAGKAADSGLAVVNAANSEKIPGNNGGDAEIPGNDVDEIKNPAIVADHAKNYGNVAQKTGKTAKEGASKKIANAFNLV